MQIITQLQSHLRIFPILLSTSKYSKSINFLLLAVFKIFNVYFIKGRATVEAKVEERWRLRPRLGLDGGKGRIRLRLGVMLGFDIGLGLGFGLGLIFGLLCGRGLGPGFGFGFDPCLNISFILNLCDNLNYLNKLRNLRELYTNVHMF